MQILHANLIQSPMQADKKTNIISDLHSALPEASCLHHLMQVNELSTILQYIQLL